MTSSESEGQGTASRKRSRGSVEGNGAKESKKARGRPRVDTQDATAADVSVSRMLSKIVSMMVCEAKLAYYTSRLTLCSGEGLRYGSLSGHIDNERRRPSPL